MRQTVYQVTKLHGGIWALDSRHGNEVLATTIANGLAKAGSSVRVIKVTPPAPSMRNSEERIVFEMQPPGPKKKTVRLAKPKQKVVSYTAIVIRLTGLVLLGIGALSLMQMGAAL